MHLTSILLKKGELKTASIRIYRSFINECRDNNDHNVFFIAIADGEYYQRKNGKAGLSRIENLRSKCTQSVRVGTIYELPSILSLL